MSLVVRWMSLLVGLLAIGSPIGATAAANPWSLTLYTGPATHTIFSDTVTGDCRDTIRSKCGWDYWMVGLAADRRLAYLGWGWNLIAEGQVDVFTGPTTYPSIALGIGAEYHHFPWEDTLPTAFSVVIGPSYSWDPPQIYPSHSFGSKKNLLNYVSGEIAFALPDTRHWDAVFRVYHRSGVWGIYTLDPDEATVVGLGIRYRM